MNKKLKIVLVTFIVIVILLVVGYFSLKFMATSNANEFMKKFKEYKTELTELNTGKYFDFSTDKNTITNTKMSEGIVFKDINDKINIISNLKINGLFCSFDNNKFNCGILNKKDTGINEIKTYKEYKIGDAITLNDNTKWHVINNSNMYTNFVTLVLDTRVDINGDGFTMDTGNTKDPDRIPYDKNGTKKYDITKDGNIGYYIENTYKPSLTQLKDIFEIRLLTNKELESIEETINFSVLEEKEVSNMQNTEEEILNSIEWMDEYPRPYHKLGQIKLTEEQYNKLMPHWLYNSFSGNYWIYFSDNKVRTAVWNGNGYSSCKPTTGYSLKPVITLSKENVKN